MSEMVFNALTGPELKTAILDHIGKSLDNTGEFPANISFPWVKYEFTVGVVAYPKQDIDAEPLIKAAGEFQTPAPIPAPGETEPAQVFAVVDSKTINTPDKARIESGQPVPTTQPGANGVLVDKLVEVQPPVPAQRKGTFQKAQNGVSNGSGNA